MVFSIILLEISLAYAKPNEPRLSKTLTENPQLSDLLQSLMEFFSNPIAKLSVF